MEKSEEKEKNEELVSEKSDEQEKDNIEEKEEKNVEEKEESNDSHDDKKEETEKPKKKGKGSVVFFILVILVLVLLCCYLTFFGKKSNNSEKSSTSVEPKEYASEYRLSGNGLEDFDLYFLQLENSEKNKVYSPLSIKYALEMLAEGANGDTRSQIEAIIGDYKPKSYPNSEHMSFANAMFIRNTYQDAVKSDYIDLLKSKYNAEVIYDSFETPNTINNWVSDRTFKLINDLVDDASDNDFFLVNALAIDMEWNNQIHCTSDHKIPCITNGSVEGHYGIYYAHERLHDEDSVSYEAVSPPYSSEDEFYGSFSNERSFTNYDNIKAADVLADFNRYDIIKELGEDSIRETVKTEYEKWLAEEGSSLSSGEEDVDKYLDQYIEELKENYGKKAFNTDFMLYEDDEVKSFAKDLKEYDGMTLQYVGIMPKEKSLKDYIKDSNAKDINKVITSLKVVNYDNFEEGYATRIRGYIPFFNYDYELNLIDDLKELGVTNIFDDDAADLSNMVEGPSFINKAIHKANIEFSNDGIKASAATAMGGYGAARGGFDYLFTIPVKEIDITFNNPYMYIIRDKDSGEVWFTGTVYEPTHR